MHQEPHSQKSLIKLLIIGKILFLDMSLKNWINHILERPIISRYLFLEPKKKDIHDFIYYVQIFFYANFNCFIFGGCLVATQYFILIAYGIL